MSMKRQHSDRPGHLSRRVEHLMQITASVNDFFINSEWSRRVDEPQICDFVLGNPHEMPLPRFSDALKRWSDPQSKFRYSAV